MNAFITYIRSLVQHYDHQKYWYWRDKITSHKGSKLHRAILLYKIKVNGTGANAQAIITVILKPSKPMYPEYKTF